MIRVHTCKSLVKLRPLRTHMNICDDNECGFR